MNTIKTITASARVGAELFCASEETKKKIRSKTDIIDLISDVLSEIVKRIHPEIVSNKAVKRHIKRTARKYRLNLLEAHIVEQYGNKEVIFYIQGGNIYAFAAEIGLVMMPERDEWFRNYVLCNPHHQQEVIYDCTKDLLPA